MQIQTKTFSRKILVQIFGQLYIFNKFVDRVLAENIFFTTIDLCTLPLFDCQTQFKNTTKRQFDNFNLRIATQT